MDKDVCFKLGSELLTTEQTLVIFDVPIFFICTDSNNNRYSVLCTDSIKLTYIIVKSLSQDILDMLLGKIKIIDLFFKNEECYYVIAGDDYMSDIVNKRLTSELYPEELPEKDAYFELSTPAIRRYIDILSNDVFKSHIINETYETYVPFSYTTFNKEYKFLVTSKEKPKQCKKSKSENVMNYLFDTNEISINYKQVNNTKQINLSNFNPIIKDHEVCCYGK